MVSARMHPLILAAGSGTPIVGMAYNGKFCGWFGMLGLPDRYLWLRDFKQDPGSFVSRLKSSRPRRYRTGPGSLSEAPS